MKAKIVQVYGAPNSSPAVLSPNSSFHPKTRRGSQMLSPKVDQTPQAESDSDDEEKGVARLNLDIVYDCQHPVTKRYLSNKCNGLSLATYEVVALLLREAWNKAKINIESRDTKHCATNCCEFVAWYVFYMSLIHYSKLAMTKLLVSQAMMVTLIFVMH